MVDKQVSWLLGQTKMTCADVREAHIPIVLLVYRPERDVSQGKNGPDRLVRWVHDSAKQGLKLVIVPTFYTVSGC